MNSQYKNIYLMSNKIFENLKKMRQTFRHNVKIINTHSFFSICNKYIVFKKEISKAGNLILNESNRCKPKKKMKMILHENTKKIQKNFYFIKTVSKINSNYFFATDCKNFANSSAIQFYNNC